MEDDQNVLKSVEISVIIPLEFPAGTKFDITSVMLLNLKENVYSPSYYWCKHAYDELYRDF